MTSITAVGFASNLTTLIIQDECWCELTDFNQWFIRRLLKTTEEGFNTRLIPSCAESSPFRWEHSTLKRDVVGLLTSTWSCVCVSSDVTVVGSCRHIGNSNHKIRVNTSSRTTLFSSVCGGETFTEALRRRVGKAEQEEKKKKHVLDWLYSHRLVFTRLLKQLWWAEKVSIEQKILHRRSVGVGG